MHHSELDLRQMCASLHGAPSSHDAVEIRRASQAASPCTPPDTGTDDALSAARGILVATCIGAGVWTGIFLLWTLG